MASGDQPVEGPVVAPEARRAAEELAADLPALASGMFAFLVTRIPEIDMDAETQGLTLASCTSSLEVGLSMLRHGIPSSRAEANVAALEHARHMAARGLSIDGTLRFYRLGLAWFWELWVEKLGSQISDPARLAEVLRETAAFSFDYTDALSTRVSVELLAERDRRERRIAAEREEVVAAILSGATVDVPRAERTLAFTFTPRHVAFVCWADAEQADLERIAAACAAALGDGRPLLVSHGGAEITGWQHVGADALRTAALAEQLPPGVRIAFGTAQAGLGGFRQTHDEARRAQRCAQLARDAASAVTEFEAVRFVDLLSRDLPAARAFVAQELGALARDDERSAGLRAFLRAFLATDGNATATAAALGLHRNTMRQRLARAEELRGRPVTQGGGELRAALALTEALGAAVLDAG